MKSESESEISSEIKYLLRKESNCLCADCFDSCTLYVDVDNCVFLCKSCSDIHKQLGFHIKNPLNDTFTFDEIQNLKKTDNETFNKKMMSLYQHDSPPIPFGASDPERISFIEDKYIEKKWFSPIPNENNQSFYNRKHFDIVEENDKTDDEQFLDSESETSEITSPNEPNFFGLHQKQNLIMSIPESVVTLYDENVFDNEKQEENISHEEENYELGTPQKLLLKTENYQTFDDHENDSQNKRLFRQVNDLASKKRSQKHVENYNNNPIYEPISPQFGIQNQQFDASLVSPQDQNNISHNQEFAPGQQQFDASLLDISYFPRFYIQSAPYDFNNDENKSGEILANNQKENQTSQEPNNSTIVSNLSSNQKEDQTSQEPNNFTIVSNLSSIQNKDQTSQEPNNFTIVSNLSSIQNEDQVTIRNQIINANADDENNKNNEILNSNESKNEFMKNNKKESFHQESTEVNKKKFTIEIICLLMAILLFAFRIFIH